MSPDEFAEYSRNLLRSMNEMKSKSVTVGIQSEDATRRAYKGGATVLEVGLYHELGLGVPRRSFLQVPFSLKSDQMSKSIDNALKLVTQGSVDPDTALGFIGIEGVNIVKMAFTSEGYGTWPPLKQATIDAKGSSQTLIDTGVLRNSISYKVVNDAQ